MSDESQKKIFPPYLAFQSLKNFVDGMRSTALPARIDKSVMGTLSGGTQSALLLTLKYLKLVDAEGVPSPDLKQLVEGNEQNTKKVYAQLVGQRYGFLAQRNVNLETATQHQLEEAFEAQELSGDTLRKAVSFLVLMASEAGLKVSPHLKAAKRKTGSGATRRPRRRSNGGHDHDEPPPPPPAPLVPVDPPGHKTYKLDLDPEGKRFLRVTAPSDLSEDDIARLAGWMPFQWGVGWKKGGQSK